MGWLTSSLRRRLLLFVGLPLTVQILLSFYLFKEFSKFEELAEHQAMAKELIGRSNWLQLLLTASALSWVEYIISGEKTHSRALTDNHHAVAEQLVALDEILADTPTPKETIKNLRQATQHCLAALPISETTGRIPASDLGKLTLIKSRLFSKDFAEATAQFRLERKNLLEGQRNRLQLSSEDLPHSRRYLKELIATILVLNLLVTLALTIIYCRYVERRLLVMKENAERIASNQSLKPLLPGTDELSLVDKTLHDLQEALTAARKKEQELVHMKQQILDMVAHDLRTPITSLLGVFEILGLQRAQEDQTTRMELVSRGEQIAKRLINLTGDLLLIEKAEAGMLSLELTECMLDNIFAEAAKIVSPLADKSNIKIHIKGGNISLKADPDRLIQVLTNLLSNAIKFSDPDKCIYLDAVESADLVEIRVSDEGRGIPEAQVEHIFDRYRQILAADSAAGRGAGLGLAICKTVVELHGGNIECTSVPGQGTVFCIKLPKATEPPDHSPNQE